MKTMRTAIIICAMAVSVSLCAAEVRTETLVLQNGLNGYAGTDDNLLGWYDASTGTKNNGTFLTGQVGNGRLDRPMNTLLRFSGLNVLQGQYTSIDSVTLTLTQSRDDRPVEDMVGKVLQVSDGNAGWVEGTGNWVTALPGESCGYYKAYYPTSPTPWVGGYGLEGEGGTAGEMGSFTVAGYQPTNTSYNISLPTTVIEQWINGINAGMLIKDDPRVGNAPLNTQYWPYHSSGSATATGRPKLTIEYTTDFEPPPPPPFKFGWWDSFSTNSAAAIAAEGASIALAYSADYYSTPGDGPATTQAWLDSAHAAGLKVISGVPYEYVRDKDTAALQTFMNQFKDHPAVVGWFISDEPTDGYHDEALLAYNTIKALSSHPVSIVFCYTDNKPNAFADSYNTLLFDRYPCRTGDSEFDYARFQEFKSFLDWGGSKATELGKPWMAVLQAFGGWSDTLEFRLPTSDEARFMTYYAIEAGASGALFYPRYRSTRLRRRVGRLNSAGGMSSAPARPLQSPRRGQASPSLTVLIITVHRATGPQQPKPG
jgi:hypothetical protein